MTAIERKLDKLLIAANDPQRTPAERRFAYQRATELMTALLVSLVLDARESGRAQ
jgi:hypothetical protein